MDRKLIKYLNSANAEQWWLNRADQIAMSGRHRPALFNLLSAATTKTPVSEKVNQLFKGRFTQPTVAYRGYISENHVLPQFSVKPEEPTWWSGYGDVAHGYVTRPGGTNPVTAGNLLGNRQYIAQANVADLKKAGPHSPFFTPHIAQDNRSDYLQRLMSRIGGKKYDLYSGSNEWGKRPHYESVFTQGSQNPLDTVTNLYKRLPSGRGFQQVYEKPVTKQSSFNKPLIMQK